MMTFSQYLEENKIMAAALAGIVGGVGLGLSSRPNVQTPQPEAQVQPKEEPKQAQPKQEVKQTQNNTQKFHDALKKKHGTEYDTIMKAALRNGIKADDHENLSLLFAIRKAENGGPGVEFGVLHPKAKNTNLDTQAGWAAATILKNKSRMKDFTISKFAKIYAPPKAENDPKGLNANWASNVEHHYTENMAALQN